jgi:hypothetical protein
MEKVLCKLHNETNRIYEVLNDCSVMKATIIPHTSESADADGVESYLKYS